MTPDEQLTFYRQFYDKKLTDYFSKELTPAQRMKITSFFKLAEDLKECKMVYAFLVQTMINDVVARIKTETKINWDEVPVNV